MTWGTHEFNPFASRAADVVVDNVDASALIAAGHHRQEQALDLGEIDEVEEPAPRTSMAACSQAQAAAVHPLSSLLTPLPLPPALEPTPYVADMTVDATARKKQKTQHQKKEKRRFERWVEQMKVGSSMKGIAQKKTAATTSQAVVVSYKTNSLGGWASPRIIPQKFSIKILSVPDALSYSGLSLVR